MTFATWIACGLLCYVGVWMITFRVGAVDPSAFVLSWRRWPLRMTADVAITLVIWPLIALTLFCRIVVAIDDYAGETIREMFL